MQAKIKQHLQNQHRPLKEAIKDVVRIPSVIEEGGAGFTFGKGVDNALRTTLQIAERLGFQTK